MMQRQLVLQQQLLERQQRLLELQYQQQQHQQPQLQQQQQPQLQQQQQTQLQQLQQQQQLQQLQHLSPAPYPSQYVTQSLPPLSGRVSGRPVALAGPSTRPSLMEPRGVDLRALHTSVSEFDELMGRLIASKSTSYLEEVLTRLSSLVSSSPAEYVAVRCSGWRCKVSVNTCAGACTCA